MSPRWLHWPAADEAATYDILQVTGPGSTGDIIPGYDVSYTDCLFSFTSGDFPYDTWGIVRWGLKETSGDWYVCFDFVDATAKSTFTSAYPAGDGFTIISSGSFGTSTVTFSGTTSRGSTGRRWNVASPGLSTLASDISANATVTVNNP
jgi:hypothetical protein